MPDNTCGIYYNKGDKDKIVVTTSKNEVFTLYKKGDCEYPSTGGGDITVQVDGGSSSTLQNEQLYWYENGVWVKK